ncbi:hypothetical protein GCM10010411_62930 [Actinomadura fulvescens]|uniref:Uncharacterized protein n=1 Tax=Actinomadura fulvescens TaxID=46160 RepID=A0ABN3Q8F8_9ACTN
MTGRPVRYRDMGQVGEWFGVSGKTVSKWRTRYADDHPCPEPDAMTGEPPGETPGWLPDRENEWRAWHASRPGQGAKGRPKLRRQPDGDQPE